MSQDTLFGRFAKKASTITGKPATFLAALALVIGWAASGPVFQYSETWQLVINTSTTIITFLMVFIIQHTQNKDTAAMQIKLDELVRANQMAHNAVMGLEEMKEDEIEALRCKYLELGEDAVNHLRSGTIDDMKPEVEETFDIGKPRRAKPKKKPVAKTAKRRPNGLL